MKKKETTESEIIAHIKQSLENYEEAYIPGSWEGFVQKRAINKRKLFLRIASGIAACLLVGFIGFNLIDFDRRETSRILPEQTAKTTVETPDSRIKPTEKSTTVVAQVKTSDKHFDSVTPASKPIALQKEDKIVAKENNTEGQMTIAVATNDSVKKVAALAVGINQPSKNMTDTVKIRVDTTRSQITKTYPFTPLPEEKQKLAATTGRKIRFGVNFSPGVNTTQSASALNYMGGVSADIPLSSKFQLSTGLQIENQSIVKEFPSIAASSSAPLNQTRTKLINLDVPVNITWTFVSEKSRSYYISAGLSSMVYLKQEDKNTNYSQLMVQTSSMVAGDEVKSYSVMEQVSVTQNRVTPLQPFDFAGRINFMIGFEKKLSDKLFIHFEPYTKIPTSGQAPGSLNHTTSGINFKISF